MPTDDISRISKMGRRQGMPGTSTFVYRYELEIINFADDVDDDQDSDYTQTSAIPWTRFPTLTNLSLVRVMIIATSHILQS